MPDSLFPADYWFARFLIQRALGAVYLVAFLVAANQFRPLVGERGLLPLTRFLKTRSFRSAPSIFHWHYSDRFFGVAAWTGVVLSAVALSGLSDSGPVWVSMLIWFLLWALYLSIVNVGQTFYGFGWESMTLEVGFYAIFLGPSHIAMPVPLIWIICWMLFRVEFGAGLIKMRGDRCWRYLTCMYYHHETQPLPNPVSRFVHKLPKPLHRLETLGNHSVQLIAVWGLFFPQPVASIAASLIILSQGYLVLTGNYSWLNWLTIVLAFSGFSDGVIQTLFGLSPPATVAAPLYFEVLVILLVLLVAFLSINPVRNMLSRRQMMNYSFNQYHLVNTYGAFGSVTRTRREIILEGTAEDTPGPGDWKAYEFKGKPGDPCRRPAQIAPYHLRLDWQMWFAAMSERYAHPWFLRLVHRLLENDRQTVKLLKHNPFPDDPPKQIRARLFRYKYTSREEQKRTGRWWDRSFIREYLAPTSL